mmetsp:Transcript_35100/g.35736  ORF Transcript_35100/g.35736 Transcript_35100/m.35736 type:complete len:470 (+) Transcript_35100:203-1612(+)|eukprot:CAMPEP_0182427768 /NCGR_PEP_ID=MMETSP1167-20130531/19362_1 /TAXON_ID=2988 /ORGANISM="Mallomonas Sp, Strain CCMP3275" /LENGTH=469 /DNA_ID=CAMNT_0024610233 /DNA_START=196 /DNA_END=1605 /DNA_ORIENTATION=+
MNRGGAFQQIQSRRRVENERKAVEQTIIKDRRNIDRAQFEITTTKKIDQRMKQQRYEEIMRQQERSLLERRRQLAALYNFELESWTEDVMSRVETVEDKKNRIKERAYALREKREEERQKNMQERLEKQWKDSLDEFRTANSSALTRVVKEEVLKQIAEKIQRRQNLSDEENSHVTQWKLMRDREEERDRQKEEARRAASQKLVEELRAQIVEIQQRKRNEFDNRRRADEDELRRIRAALAAEEADQKRRQEEGKRRGQEILQYNIANKAVMEQEKALRSEQDRILLNYALYQEQEAAEMEENKKHQNKLAAEEYRNYLKEQMIHEAEDTALVDRMRKIEEDKVWKAREDELRAREEARQNLQTVVHQGRQDQIMRNERARMHELSEESEWADKFIDDARRGLEMEKKAAYERRMIAAQNQAKLADQIKMREDKQAMDRQDAYLADKIAQRNARLQSQRVDAMVRAAYK